MRESPRLNATLAFLAGVYYLAISVYHHQIYPQLEAAQPTEIQKLTGFSPTFLLSDTTTNLFYAINGMLATWFFLVAVTASTLQSNLILFLAMAVWMVRLVVWQPTYLFVSELHRNDFGILVASVLVVFPLMLLIAGPENILIDAEDEERMQETMRKELETLIDTKYGGNVEEAMKQMGGSSGEDAYIVDQMDELLATIDKELEEEKQAKRKKKESKKKK